MKISIKSNQKLSGQLHQVKVRTIIESKDYQTLTKGRGVVAFR